MTDWPLHGVAIYNPDLLSKQELVAQFVARRSLLGLLLQDLGHGETNQHHMIVGQRGMGKTTLLRRLRYAIEDDPKLSAKWLPLTFPEEQYNVARLSDLYLNCADALSDALDRMGRVSEAQALDKAIASLPEGDEDDRRRRALDVLRKGADRMKRRLVLLVDNVDLIFDRLKADAWAIRELLSSERRLLFIGASAVMMESTYQYKEPFYDFFKIHELGGLSEEETIEVLEHLAEVGNAPSVARVVKEDPGRIKTFHVLAGGNPRTIVLLYDVLSKGVEGDVRSDLERLLDRVTPLYKARFEELPAQSQQIVDALAIHWDPASAGEVAALVRLDVNVVSSQLNRLEKQGILEKVPYYPTAKTGFQVAERFFNIWYLMRASRRVRQRLIWLVEFLRRLYGRDELKVLAERHLREQGKPADGDALKQAEYGLALAQAVESDLFKRALENVSVRALAVNKELRAQLASLMDLEGDDAALKPVVDRHKALAEAKEAVFAAKVKWKGWDPEKFWELLGGSMRMSPARKASIAISLTNLGEKDVKGWITSLKRETHSWQAIIGCDDTLNQLRKAFVEGYVDDVYNISDMQSAEIALNLPGISALALAFSMSKKTDPEMIETFKAACHNSRSARLHCALGVVLNQYDRHEEALAAYQKATILDPLEGAAWYGLSASNGFAGRHLEAEGAARKAVELDSTNSAYWTQLGYASVHDSKESITAFRRAVMLDPKNTGASLSLASMLMATTSTWDKAASLARRFLADEGVVVNYWALVMLFFRVAVIKGHTTDALRLLDELNLADTLRPLREALNAIAAGSKLSLRRVAPEIRRPAEKLIEELLPEGLKDE